PTTYLVDTTLSDASDYDQTVHAVRLPLNATAILKERAQALQLHAQGAVWEGENRHFLKKMLNKLESYLLILK
ncbi:hypothetical protein, partial [Klebsiella pneumoniae]|uniref:hypothetical protein n=1 Tax=Klebsiella pneumoniae TaxID=573 RepID=UPI001F5BA28C